MISNSFLTKPLRTQLENTVKAAREVAEDGAQAALFQLAVGEARVPDYLTEEQRTLRHRLRVHGDALGDRLLSDDSQTTQHLVWEIAYEHWHRMLFARFLAESNLLLWEPGAPVTLAECEELAQDPATSLGAKSGWELAGSLAARMLPQVFKPKSPVFELTFAREHQRELERLLAGLPEQVFMASDSLGWVYQFWQAKRKDEVNASGVKIGADELPAVTQLFTENYMVEFLLHNSLGAWWVTRFPDKPCPVELTYLRKMGDGTPAAGKFEGWPDQLSEFKLLDPCCGSGHFLVAAFQLLVPMRMAAEGLSARQAVDAVMENNLYGLELDQRCVEIAVFALALAAWRYLDESGVQLGVRAEMPTPILACCGLKVSARPQDWEALVPNSLPDAKWLRQEMRLLHAFFSKATVFGSLLDPSQLLKRDLATPGFDVLTRLLEQGLAGETPIYPGVGRSGELDDTWDTAVSAQGLLAAAGLLVQRYDLVITNVPYLARGKQSGVLREYCDLHYPDAKNDLANVFLERCVELAKKGGSGIVQIVMPQNWLFLGSYKKQRESLLKRVRWSLLARLGPGAFETISGEVVNVILITQTNAPPSPNFVLRGLDASAPRTAQGKAELLRLGGLAAVSQKGQLGNPDGRVSLDEGIQGNLLSKYADSYVGLQNGDTPRFVFQHWECPAYGDTWTFLQMTTEDTRYFDGCDAILRWENGSGGLLQANARIQGVTAWDRRGVAVRLMRELPCSLYMGQKYDQSSAVVLPKNQAHLPAIWCFCSSPQFNEVVRRIDQKLNVTSATLVKVPFDLGHWQQIAAERYPNGLPNPYSDSPTQWLFHGHPQVSTDPLQVATARLLGYSWPAESDERMELSEESRTWIARCKALARHVDDDGIVCLSPLRGEKSAHDRLLALLIDTWETVKPGTWKTAILDRLLANSDCAGKGLDVWLRDKFFEQHAKLFQHRPFIWHIWDGLKDGFGALVNYHKFDAKSLERLVHTYLGDWIRAQETEVNTGVDGAQGRLAAALQLKTKLAAILEGERPLDIFVRWKGLAHQSIGWNPDLNDGIKFNIRPFMKAEVLRHNNAPKLNIKWDMDRGKDVVSTPWYNVFGGDRINDHHLTLAEKRAAREKKK